MGIPHGLGLKGKDGSSFQPFWVTLNLAGCYKCSLGADFEPDLHLTFNLSEDLYSLKIYSLILLTAFYNIKIQKMQLHKTETAAGQQGVTG